MKNTNTNTIEKVWIERQVDDSPDTSFLGEYTDKKSDWVICRRCGEFVAIAEEDNKEIDEIENEIIDLENEEIYEAADNSKEIKELKDKLDNLILHECPHSSREYNYFKPYAGGELEGSDNYIKYGKQDFERMEGLNNSNWCFIGIIAKTEIRAKSGTLQTITSGGLWGIESDSGKDYLDQVGKEQLEGLRKELESLGFKENEIDKAFLNAEIEE